MTPSLVILAAGMGSRYGGIKQLDGFGPNGERIIDYTVYDALKCGYGKIVFVIRDEIEKDFTEAVLKKWESFGDIRVVHQSLEKIPSEFPVPEGRQKPWGTAHATWMAEEVVNEPFATVNADDFYGVNSLQSACDYLSSVDNDQHAACLIGYQIQNTLTDSGSVSRGVCSADQSGFLTGIVERTKISKDSSGQIFFEEDGVHTNLEDEALVSMNLIGFSSKVFEEIREGFAAVHEQSQSNLKAEYYIPSVLNSLIQKGVKAPVISTEDQWFGVTYSEDKPWVKEQFKKLHQNGTYPENLWEK